MYINDDALDNRTHHGTRAMLGSLVTIPLMLYVCNAEVSQLLLANFSNMRPICRVMLFSQERIITFHCVSSNQTANQKMVDIHTDQSKERHQSLSILSPSKDSKVKLMSIDCETRMSVKQMHTHSRVFMEQRWFSSHR